MQNNFLFIITLLFRSQDIMSSVVFTYLLILRYFAYRVQKTRIEIILSKMERYFKKHE